MPRAASDVAVDSEAWLGRCRDKRGEWCLGPTTFNDARTQTKNWVLGLPVGGKADEWFLSNPIREYTDLMVLLSRPTNGEDYAKGPLVRFPQHALLLAV